jgi:hypothetical protein
MDLFIKAMLLSPDVGAVHHTCRWGGRVAGLAAGSMPQRKTERVSLVPSELIRSAKIELKWKKRRRRRRTKSTKKPLGLGV